MTWALGIVVFGFAGGLVGLAGGLVGLFMHLTEPLVDLERDWPCGSDGGDEL